MYKCRVCGSNKLEQYLSLGNLPLSNNLCNTITERALTYPLKVLICRSCWLSQLSIVIAPEILFEHYVYRSSISEGYKIHCREMAESFKDTLTKDSFHIDIAGNDGALLHEFNQVIGCRTLNIDPARNLVEINNSKNIRQFTAFWGKKAAQHLINTYWPKADLITATNVFAHVDNVSEFIEACKMVLKPDGVIVLEFPYLIDFIERGEFDTIYFEHLSYFSISPLLTLCKKVGLNIQRVEKYEIHGGSVRVYIGLLSSDDTVIEFLKNELQYQTLEPYRKFTMKTKETIKRFKSNLIELANNGNKIAGFAASAKGNTLLNCSGIQYPVMKYIIDETPEKIGKFSPGTHIPIIDLRSGLENNPDYIVILSWNFKDEIINKCRLNGYDGKFILPLTFEVI